MNATAAALKQQSTREDPAHLIPVLAYSGDDKLFYMEDGYLGFALRVMPMTGANDEVADKLNTVLSLNYPTDTFVQMFLYASPDIKTDLESITKLRPHLNEAHTEADAILRSAIEGKVNLYQSCTNRPIERVYGTVIRDFQLCLSVKIPTKRVEMPTEKEMASCKELRVRMQQSLEAMGLPNKAMNAGDYIRYMGTIVNWSDDAAWRQTLAPQYNDRDYIKNQIFDYDSGLHVDDSRIMIGEKVVTVMSPRRLPEYMALGAMPALIGDVRSGAKGIRGNFAICLNIHYPDFHAEKSKHDTKRQYVTYQNFGAMTKFVPRIATKKDSYDTLYAAVDAGDRIVKICPAFILFNDNQEEASEAAANMTNYYREVGFHMQEDKYVNLTLFTNMLPLCAERQALNFSRRYHTVAIRHACQFAPVVADWKGTGTHALTFVSRNGQLMGVDLFNSSSNYNATISAQSGSGKSFLTNDIIVSYRSLGAKIWVIDVGRSYLKLAHALGGDFIEFTKESQICLNPFPLIEDYDEEVDVIAGLIIAMAAPTDKLTDLQTAAVKETIKTKFDEKGKELIIDDLATAFKASEDQRIRDLGTQLFPFTTRGEYGRFFNGPNNVSFDNPFTVLELEELKGREHLQQVVLLQLIYQIQQEMYTNMDARKFPKIVIIDEAWDLLSKGNVAKFIESGYRRFRKYNGSAITITQSINDLYANPCGEAIAANSAHQFLLGQKPETVSVIQREKRIELSDGGYELLKTVRTIPGAFSEIFFYWNSGASAGIGRLIVDRYWQLFYTTKPDEINAINHRMDSGMTMDEAIRDIIRFENEG